MTISCSISGFFFILQKVFYDINKKTKAYRTRNRADKMINTSWSISRCTRRVLGKSADFAVCYQVL